MITNSIVSNNDAGADEPFPAGFGGGISNYGTVTITNSTINSNLCYLAGGGILQRRDANNHRQHRQRQRGYWPT